MARKKKIEKIIEEELEKYIRLHIEHEKEINYIA